MHRINQQDTQELKYEKSMWFCIVLDCNRHVYHDAPSQSCMGCYSAVNFPRTRVSSVLLLRSKKRGCRKIIKLDDRAISLNLKGKTEVISPVLWLTSVFWRTLIKIFVFSIFKQVFLLKINVFLFGHSVFSREVY